MRVRAPELVRAPRVNPVGVAFESVTKQFGEKVALDALSMEIPPGSFLVLLGPSGSGKTTLLRCLAGIERPTRGSISIDGREVVGSKRFVEPEKRGLAMVFQDYALWPHMTVERNISFALRRTEVDRATGESRVAAILERVGLVRLRDRYPGDLSGGEQQRVALARALVADVGLILFDEPLSNLDADRREQLRIEIATLARESGATCVYITHDQAEAFALADQIGVLNEGELVQLGSPESIYRDPANAFVARFTGVAGELPAEVLGSAGVGLSRVRLALEAAPQVIARARQPLAPGARARLFVRAAGASLHEDHSDESLHGIVTDVAFCGRGYEHVVDVGSGYELTKVFSLRRFERGAVVGISLDAESCFLFTPDLHKES